MRTKEELEQIRDMTRRWAHKFVNGDATPYREETQIEKDEWLAGVQQGGIDPYLVLMEGVPEE